MSSSHSSALGLPVIGYVRHHHERVDGEGYPDGLRDEQIPLGARIIAVADAYDAMTQARPYRPALPPDAVVAELGRGRGRQWDERVVDALLELVQRLYACSKQGCGVHACSAQNNSRELSTSSVAA